MTPRARARWLLLAPALALACVPGPLDETGRLCSAARPCGETFVCVAGRCQDELFDAGPPDAGTDGGRADAGVDAGAGRDAGADAGPDAGGPDAGADAGPADAGSADAGALDGGLPDGGEVDAGLDDDAGYPADVNLLANPGFELITSDGGVRNWRASAGVLMTGVPGRSGARAARLFTSTATSPGMQSDIAPGQTSFGMLFCAEAWVRHELDAGPAVTLIIRDRFNDGGIDGSNGGSATIQPGAWRRLREQYLSFGGGRVDVRVTTTRVEPDASVLVDDVLLFRASGSACVFP